ncbi:unnamed protein product [Prorocentrum cordatum]|uniref:Uncharacterized protein n=1 Tax=Prorocentrum cordatum TaxID=2364126 RepID=A0ABN9XD13_9DINO|nr:unnamed protein product [Polarella glacialis]
MAREAHSVSAFRPRSQRLPPRAPPRAMKMPLAALALALAVAPIALAAGSEVTPVQKVITLMENMLAKGKAEKHDEEVQYAAYKQFCGDTTVEKDKAIREADEKIEVLKADIEKYEATAAKMTKEIADHEADVAGWAGDMEAATGVRKAEKAAYTDEHKVIESDFARLEADTKAAEAAAQKEYDTFMTDSKVDKEGKETDVEHKTAKKGAEEQALASTQSDLEGTQKELDAALAYFDKLKPSCVSEGVDYDERVQRRQEEIESLQEALRILNGKEIV